MPLSPTPNMGLVQPTAEDLADIGVINANSVKLDGHTHGGPPDGQPVKAVQSGPNAPTSSAGPGQLYVSTGAPALYFADGSHWVQLQNAPTAGTKIAEVSLTSSGSSVVFTSIPQTFRHLQIHWQAGGTGPMGFLMLNGDGNAANYCTVVWWATGTSASNADMFQDTGGFYFGAYGSSGYSGSAAGVISIPNYRGGFAKQLVSSWQGIASMARGNLYVGHHGGLWNNTAAVTSISIWAGQIAAGSVFTLYGMM